MKTAKKPTPLAIKPVVKRRSNVTNLFDIAEDILNEEALAAGHLGFFARVLVLTTMPHNEPKTNSYSRSNGVFRLHMANATESAKLPYGTYPRLIMAWLCTQVVKTKQDVIALPPTTRSLMREVGMRFDSGKEYKVFREQAIRLFGTVIDFSRVDKPNQTKFRLMRIAEEVAFPWDATVETDEPEVALIKVSPEFYKELIDHPVPFDLRAYRALSKSPMAMDIYVWLSYRMWRVHKKTAISWRSLQKQIGADYPRTKQGRQDFRRNFLNALKKVKVLYPAAKTCTIPGYLVLIPSSSHITKRALK